MVIGRNVARSARECGRVCTAPPAELPLEAGPVPQPAWRIVTSDLSDPEPMASRFSGGPSRWGCTGEVFRPRRLVRSGQLHSWQRYFRQLDSLTTRWSGLCGKKRTSHRHHTDHCHLLTRVRPPRKDRSKITNVRDDEHHTGKQTGDHNREFNKSWPGKSATRHLQPQYPVVANKATSSGPIVAFAMFTSVRSMKYRGTNAPLRF